MAPSNATRMYAARYQAAINKFNRARHEESIEEFTDLLLDPYLPHVYRLMCNIAMADGTDTWALAESFRKDAEEMYDEIIKMTPSDDPRGEYTSPNQKMAELREALDSLKDD